MVSSLVRDADASAASAIAAMPQVSAGDPGGYGRHLSCQIWSLGGRLVAASTSGPSERLSGHTAGFSVGRGLSPLRGIASNLQQRAADDLAPLQARVIDEIRPVMDALNGLFSRLDAARRYEREFTSFAAHELRTPLAGIRSQAQIAKAADTVDMRVAALDQIVLGVDRTARLVSQLLALARLNSGPTRPLSSR